MHPSRTSSLQTRPSRQRSPQFHHGTADFIANGDFAAVVLNWGAGGGVVIVRALCFAGGAAGCGCCCVGCCYCFWGAA